MAILAGLALFFALTVWGRRLRENAFRQLPPEATAKVINKLPSYTATEQIPFAGLILGLVAVLLFRNEWITIAFPTFIVLIVILVAVLHVRTRNRFRAVGLPMTFQSQYEKSRIVTYSALGVLISISVWVWVLYL